VTKKLIICADGTWNNPVQQDRGRYRPTNVVKMASGLAPRDADGNDQIIYYEPGIGTEGIVDSWLSGFTGLGLTRTVKSAYTFLVNNYEPGDLIYCFGFSRGAFIVRSLCGLVGKVGLLRKKYIFRYEDAYDLYRDKEVESDSKAIREFRNNRVQPDPIANESNPSVIHFVGIWDTVGALGIPVTGTIDQLAIKSFSFHDVALNPYLPYAYHALAIDERREAYTPTLWKNTRTPFNRDVQQVWFAGAHANVGGGYEDFGLSNIAFIWMKEKAHECGLCFDEDFVHEHYYLSQNHLGEIRDSVSGIFAYLPRRIREIGELDQDGTPVNAGEHIHGSALLRRKHLGASYSPPNLPDDIEQRLPVVPYTPPPES
jgi:uncharacterized protein (DUF2235 family)